MKRHLVAVMVLTFGLLPRTLHAQPTGPETTLQIQVDRFGDPLPEGVMRRFGSLRFRHAGGYKSISAIAFSPNGKQIASAGPDHTVRLWGLDGRERMRLIGTENDEFTSVAFSPDGSTLAAHGDNELRVWDVDSGKLLMHILGGRGSSPVFSADSKRVAATKLYYTPMGGYLDRSFRVWDVETGTLLHTLDSSKRLLWPLAVALDNNLTASHDEKGIKIRRLDTGETVQTYNKHRAKNRHGLHRMQGAGIPTVAFGRDGKSAASACLLDGALDIHVWDPLTGKTTSSQKSKTSFAAYALAFSPDGETLLGAASVRDFDGGYAGGKIAVDSPAQVDLIDAATAEPRLHVEGFGAPALSHCGRLLAAARFDGIQLFDARTGEPLKRSPGHDAPVQKVAASHDGKRFASVGRDHTICYWDAVTGRLLSHRHVAGGVGNASFSSDLTRVAVLRGELENNGRRRITVWDDASDEPRFDLAVPDGDRLVALSPDGETLATWAEDAINVWNLASGGKPLRIASPGPPVVISGFAVNDEHVIAGEMSRPLRIWDVKTGKLEHQLELRVERKLGSAGGPFAISPNGSILAIYAHDTIVLYQVSTGIRVSTLPRQTTGYIAELAFSPGGKLLASSGRDGSVRLLDVSTGDVLADFQTHAVGWTSVAFSPDGNQLLTGGGSAVLELRDISMLHRSAPGNAEIPPLGDSKKQAPAKADQGDFESMFRRIDNAREFGKLTKSSLAGGTGGGTFESIPEEPTLLVGFEYTLSTFYGGHLTIKSVRPIYKTRKGETVGKWHGAPNGKVHRVKGKHGYVVTAVVAKHGHRLDGMRLLYMRVKKGRLNPDDTRRSKWIGGRGGGRKTLYATYGKPIISIFGRQGSDLDAIGFVQTDSE